MRILLNILSCAVFLFTGSLHMFAQREAWMQALPDDRCVSALSIPGAHDAATGHGVVSPFRLGVTQTYTISGLWDLGVRAFDLRPAVKGHTLHIYHGPLRVKTTFDEVIQTICSKLETHPTEFAIVLLREEVEAESEKERKLWAQKVGECINRYREKIAPLSHRMCVADLRCRILLLSRNAYASTALGGIVHGWSHSAGGTTEARIIPSNGDALIPLRIQDYYNSMGTERMMSKLAAVQIAFDWSSQNDFITFNFLSAYANTLMHLPGLATSRGYLQNAEVVHSQFLHLLDTHPDVTPAGIHFIDFAGVDSIRRGGRTYSPRGSEVLSRIIMANFK